jgi:cytoplasmic iron level regulating protein YaaA (DUF328/UPF0246 family)
VGLPVSFWGRLGKRWKPKLTENLKKLNEIEMEKKLINLESQSVYVIMPTARIKNKRKGGFKI